MAAVRVETRSAGARLMGLVLLALAEVAAGALGALTATHPAAAQVLDERFPFLENRQRRYQQQRQQDWGTPQYSPFGYQEQPQRQAPVDSSRAPAPHKPDVAPTVSILVFGDSMADWLGFGLEEAFAETPEIGILRKPKANAGLIRTEQRGESYDWPTAAREILGTEKPDFVVMMLGLSDRRGIREAVKAQPARAPAGQKQAGQKSEPQKPEAQKPEGQKKDAQQTQAAQTPAAKPADAEAPPQDQAQEELPPIVAPETTTSGTVVHEFRSEKWAAFIGRAETCSALLRGMTATRRHRLPWRAR